MTIEILEQAKQDLVDGYQFYEKQQPGVGDYFLNSLFADIDALKLYAGIHEVAFGYHRSLAKTFPFAIYYLMAGELVQVYAVLDCRIDPSTTRARLAN